MLVVADSMSCDSPGDMADALAMGTSGGDEGDVDGGGE